MLQLKEFLRELNWTEYESSAYCAIVENGPMKANDLAVKAGIPPGRVYEVVINLTNKGWLKKTGTRPAVYDAQNPRLVLQVELDNLQKRMAESLKDAEQVWELRTGRIGDSDDKSWTVSGAHGTILEVRNLLGVAGKRVRIADSRIDWLTGSDINKIRELAAKGTVITVVSTEHCIEDLKRLSAAGIDAWVTAKLDLSFYIIDEELVLMKLNNPDNATIVKDLNLGKMFVSKFDNVIKQSKKMKVDKVAS